MAKLEDSSEQKRISVTSSELKLKEEVVIPHKSPNMKCNRRTPAASKQKSDTPPQSDAPMALDAVHNDIGMRYQNLNEGKSWPHRGEYR